MFKNEHMFCLWIHQVRPAHLLHNRHEQQPSNQDNLDLSVTGEVGRVYYMEVDLFLFSFLYHSMRLLLGHFIM
jgi:hypothetical protein